MVKKASSLVYVYVCFGGGEGGGEAGEKKGSLRSVEFGTQNKGYQIEKSCNIFLTGNLERVQRCSWFDYVNKRTTRLTSGGDNFVNAISHARKKPLLAGYVFT